MSKEKTQTKQPRTVPLAIYIRDLLITAIIAAAIAMIGTYFMVINMQAQARSAVISDMSAVTQATPKVSK